MSDRTGQQIGDYRVIRRTGADNFAEFYLGVNRQTGVQATLKIARNLSDQATIQQFLAEAYKLTQLSHPNIVRILAYGEVASALYLALDYTSEETLRGLYPRGKRLDLLQVIRYVGQVAEALQYVHERGIIHGGLQPENLLPGPQEKILLNNFSLPGLGLGQPMTSDSIYYTAPEQLQRQTQVASDQYALGILAYEWLSGAPPFTSASYQEVAGQQRHQKPVPLGTLVPQISPDVEQVIMRALEKDVRARFTTVKGFAESLAETTTSTLRSPLSLASLSASEGQSSVYTVPAQPTPHLAPAQSTPYIVPVQPTPIRTSMPPVVGVSSPDQPQYQVAPKDTTVPNFVPNSGPVSNPGYGVSTGAGLNAPPPPVESLNAFGSGASNVLSNPSGPYADLQAASIQYPVYPAAPPPGYGYTPSVQPNPVAAVPVYAQPVKPAIYFPLTRKASIYLQIVEMLLYSALMALCLMGIGLYWVHLSSDRSLYSNWNSNANAAIFFILIFIALVIPACSTLCGALFGSWRGLLVSLISIIGGLYLMRSTGFVFEALIVPQNYQSLVVLLIPFPLSAFIVGLLYDRRKYASWGISLSILLLGATIICLWFFLISLVAGVNNVYFSTLASFNDRIAQSILSIVSTVLGCLSVGFILLMTFPIAIVEGIIHSFRTAVKEREAASKATSRYVQDDSK
jgi:serine/threonine protein kinase